MLGLESLQKGWPCFHLPAEDNRAASSVQGKPHTMGPDSCPNPAGGGAVRRKEQRDVQERSFLKSIFIEHGPRAKTALTSGGYIDRMSQPLLLGHLHYSKREQKILEGSSPSPNCW